MIHYNFNLELRNLRKIFLQSTRNFSLNWIKFFRVGKKDSVPGSPYSIADYRVPKNVGGETGLKKFREQLHMRGMKLILDFVPNHMGLDHPWLTEHPEYFVLSETEKPKLFAKRLPRAFTGCVWQRSVFSRVDGRGATRVSNLADANRDDGLLQFRRRTLRRGALRHAIAAAQRNLSKTWAHFR